MALDDGSSSRQRPPQTKPKLVLDSGASIHVVGDASLLSNLRDAPAGMVAKAADGNMLPLTKIGDIEMTSAGFTIPGVYFSPGVKFNLISVRQLTRQSGICTWFDGDGRAMLYAGRDLVGVAVAAPGKYGLYVLESLSVPEIAAAASSGKLVPIWCGYSDRGRQSQWTSRPEPEVATTNAGARASARARPEDSYSFSYMSSICAKTASVP